MEKFQQFSSTVAKSTHFLLLNSVMIVFSSLVIAMDYDGISKASYEALLIMDFICILYFFFEMTIMLWGKGFQEYFNEVINFIDFVVVITQVILIIVLFY